VELAFIGKNGKVYPIDEVTRAELAEGLERISRENREKTVIGERPKIEFDLFSFFSYRRNAPHFQIMLMSLKAVLKLKYGLNDIGRW